MTTPKSFLPVPPVRGITRRRTLIGAVGGLAAIAGTGATALAQANPVRVLRFSDHEPLGGMRTRFLNEVLFPAIAHESQGRLRVEAQWGGTGASSYEALGRVGRQPDLDMATVVPEYTAKELPLHQIFKSFPVGPTGGQQLAFFRQVYRDVPAFTRELAAQQVMPLYFGTGYPLAFFSKAARDTVSDLGQGKWRTASFWHQDFLRRSGATPVTMPWGPDVATALGDGRLDGLVVNVDSGYLLKAHDMAPHVMVSQDLWLGHLYLVAMKQSVWAGLSQQDQQALVRATERAYAALGRVMYESFLTQLDDLRAAGARVRVLSRHEALTWQGMTQYRSAQAAWAEQQRAQGVTDAPAVMEQVAALMREALR